MVKSSIKITRKSPRNTINITHKHYKYHPKPTYTTFMNKSNIQAEEKKILQKIKNYR